MNIIEQMLARYPAQEREHALREVMQEAVVRQVAGERVVYDVKCVLPRDAVDGRL